MRKRLLKSPFMQTVLSTVATAYLRFVGLTSKKIFFPENLYQTLDENWPAIIAVWHGEHFSIPLARQPHHKFKVLISRHRDGELNAKIAQSFGIELIRGSGSHDHRIHEKGGATAFRSMLRALQDGFSMTLTADVPKVSRKVGEGIITLAQHSARPILPLAIAHSRRTILKKSWDQSAIPLPFGRMAIAMGEPIKVKKGAEDEARLRLENTLNDITRKAYMLADGTSA